MPNEPLWVPIDEVISANQEAVEQTGEPFQLRDRGLLESALSNCQHQFLYAGEHSIIALAVVLLLSIAQNRAFAQGNKRAAFFAALMFIETNGYVCDVDGSSELADLIVSVIDRKTDKNALIEEFRKITRRSVSKSSLEALSTKL